MCLVTLFSCSNLLIIHLLRGKSDAEGPEKKARGIAVGSWAALALPREELCAESLPTAQGRRDGVRELWEHHRDLHDGCKRKHKG